MSMSGVGKSSLTNSVVWDVVYVTYNSEKWVKDCFASWKHRWGGKKINVIVVDNASTDNTLSLLDGFAQRGAEDFAGFQVVRLTENVGFGAANNIGFQKGTAEIVCFFNIDTEIQDHTIANLAQAIETSPKSVGAWELRQIPYEHPKVYDPVTRETEWCSGAAFAVRREVYEKVGGFDESFFMYAEDVDLSWRIRQEGYGILYCPKSVIRHNTYVEKGEIKFTQYAYSMRNNLLMRYRYGNLRDILSGYVLFVKLLVKNRKGWDFNRRFAAVVRTHWRLVPHMRKSKVRKGGGKRFYGLAYSRMRWGAFHEYKPAVGKVRIMVFIIDAGKGDFREVLQCVAGQTYPASQVYCVKNVQEIENMKKELHPDSWLSIMNTDTRVYADHFETLVGGMDKSCQAVCTVDENGKISEQLECYMFHALSFEGMEEVNFVKRISKASCVCVPKQTAYNLRGEGTCCSRKVGKRKV